MRERRLRRAALAAVIVLPWMAHSAAGAERLDYFGAQACAGCHAAQFEVWKGPHHTLAMQLAFAATMLGDSSGAKLEHLGITTIFFRDGDKLMVRTDDPDGALHDYPTAYTFGVYPQQQYLIAFQAGAIRRWVSRYRVGQPGAPP
jgi:hypothetical protein